MQRDGNLTSLWQHTVKDYRPKHQQVPKSVADVLIVGGGITGITTALLLQKAGKQCVIVEAHNIGYGTTGGTTAHINTFMDTSYDQIIKDFGEANARLVSLAAREACMLIKKHVHEYTIDCSYEELPAYLFSLTGEQTSKLGKIVEASGKVDIDVQYSTTSPVPIPFSKVALFSNQAQFHPLRYIHALAAAFEKAGGIILQDCRVLSVEDKETVIAETTQGLVLAQQLIYATHIPPGVNLLHLRCAPYRSYAMAARLRREKEYPEALCYDMEDPYHYYRTQQVDGINYLVVGGEDHKTAHETNTDKCFRQLESHIRNYFDVVSIPYRWSSQYYEPADGLPYIGQYPMHSENIMVATGFGGNGITYSHVAALLLTDMILKRKNPYEKLFSPSRIKPIAGFSNFVKEQADVITKLVGGIFTKEELTTAVELAPDEAKVVDYRGEKIAIYKDPAGNIHAVSAVCPHLKCSVDWNSAEKSWDCPCHGSRFSIDGELLTGPSKHDLQPINFASQGEVKQKHSL